MRGTWPNQSENALANPHAELLLSTHGIACNFAASWMDGAAHRRATDTRQRRVAGAVQ